MAGKEGAEAAGSAGDQDGCLWIEARGLCPLLLPTGLLLLLGNQALGAGDERASLAQGQLSLAGAKGALQGGGQSLFRGL
jgi:hypothetical protein